MKYPQLPFGRPPTLVIERPRKVARTRSRTRATTRTHPLALALGLVIPLLLSGCTCCPYLFPSQTKSSLSQSLTFHASFDQSATADYAQGDPQFYTTPAGAKREEATPGLNAGEVVVRTKETGRFGGGLRFNQKKAPLVFFKAKGNLPYNSTNWSGTVSFWLKVDPAKELEGGFCDPVQVTPRKWNDAAFFVEFEKRKEIPFRLGVYADFAVWNPDNRKWGDIPVEEKPLVTVNDPPFAGDQWTHVAFTFSNFNTKQPNGVARLYLNGELSGELSPREQTMTWDSEKSLILLGQSYIGLLDELSCFNRSLNDREIKTLYNLEGGVRELF
jgi:hypothetical protein